MERKESIYRHLRKHYTHIKDRYTVGAIFLQGSQNYCLDIYSDDYTSDVDSKALIIPSLDDLIYNRPVVSTTIILENNEQIDVKDIRIFFDTLLKSNTSYLELLFTDFKIINPFFKDEINELLAMREEIVNYDPYRMFACLCGMSQQKLHDLQHPFPNALPKIEKYGYDPKQLHHLIRINDFLKKLIAGTSFKDALLPDDIEYLKDVKMGLLSLEDALRLATFYNDENVELCKAQSKTSPNKKVKGQLDELRAKLIKKNILRTPPKKSYRQIFVTSDNHFYHQNIIQYENRPFFNVEEMNQVMINKWNKVVGKDDLVYILGDFSFGSALQTNQILKELKGDKILIKGNHDLFLSSKDFDMSLFVDVKLCAEVTHHNVTFLMCHYPFASNDHTKVQLYGHVHSNSSGPHMTSTLPKNSYNVGVDVNDFTPVNLSTLIHLKQTKDLKIFTTNIEKEALQQVKDLMRLPILQGVKVRIMPDVHAGNGCVIGFTSTLNEYIIPNIVGVDIGCGMLTTKLGNVELDLPSLDNFINTSIPSGFNVYSDIQKEFPRLKELRCLPHLVDLTRIKCSLGTLGGGNHFIEVDSDDSGMKYLVIHSGSRNLGVQVAKYYTKKALEEGKLADKIKIDQIIASYKQENRHQEIQSALRNITPSEPQIYLSGENYDDYLFDMQICQEFATLNRQIIAQKILDFLNVTPLEQFNTIHNYIDLSQRIIRKGAISAKKDELLLIPINMLDGCIIGKGKGNPDWNFSAPHGAGRLMSRGKARATLSLAEFANSMKGIYSTSINASTLDEAPQVYKPLEEIIENIKDSVAIIDIIKPIYNFKASEEEI